MGINRKLTTIELVALVDEECNNLLTDGTLAFDFSAETDVSVQQQRDVENQQFLKKLETRPVLHHTIEMLIAMGAHYDADTQALLTKYRDIAPDRADDPNLVIRGNLASNAFKADNFTGNAAMASTHMASNLRG